MTLSKIYHESLGLLTDLYQLTMAYGYWKKGMANRPSIFQMSFRKKPFGGGFAVFAGLGYIVDYLRHFSISESDISYLGSLRGNNQEPLFEPAFLDFLRTMRFSCDVHAMPEGTVVFPHQPLVRVSGPLLQCQLMESAILNMINFQTLVATKASRICTAAAGQDVLEFGLRRAHGVDGALAASRAAYIGGCAATSNVLAGKLFGIPTRGTHAHSWVMAFRNEQLAFDTYAECLPGNCIFLVDTFDTLAGVERAIESARQLRSRGHEMIGIRLDSGDLAYLSIQARKLLDEAGFENAVIVASNDLDETVINSLRSQDARIDVWGVGTRLVTGDPDAALGGVYKLAALQDESGAWQPKIKLSEQTIKISTPGRLQVRRFCKNGLALADVVFDEDDPLGGPEDWMMVDPLDATRMRRLSKDDDFADLLVPVFESGQLVEPLPEIHLVRQFCGEQLELFHRGILRRENPHEYPVGLEKKLHDKKTRLILAARGTELTEGGE